MKRTGTVLVCLFFAILFGIGGAASIATLAQFAHGWFETRDWQPVMAEVMDAKLDASRTSKSTTYRVTAAYRYSVDGKPFTASRVGLNDTYDNVGGWAEAQYTRLQDAMRSGRRVVAWANPADPGKAVLDRELRWDMIGLTAVFATLFPLTSLGALWMLFRAPSSGQAPKSKDTKRKDKTARRKRRGSL